MLAFELGRNEEQFDNDNIGSRQEAVGHSLFLAAMGAALKEMYAPATAAGRIYTATKAFVIYLLMSIYVANLAAVFTTGAGVVQPVSDMESFVPADLPLCARNTSGQLLWLRTNYPSVALNGLLVPTGTDTASALSALLAGACAGAVSTSADVAYALGAEGDPNGALCNLVPVGPVLGDSIFALPLTANTTQLPAGAADALGRLAALAVASGNYSAQALAQFMPSESNRPQCAAEAAASDAAVAFAASGALGIADVAGVFIVQAVGVVLSLACYFTKSHRKRAYAALARRCGGQRAAAAAAEKQTHGGHAEEEEASQRDGERMRMHIGHGPHEDDVGEVLTELSEKLAEITAKAARRRHARAGATAPGRNEEAAAAMVTHGL
jgi:hypothetical protein